MARTDNIVITFVSREANEFTPHTVFHRLLIDATIKTEPKYDLPR